MKKNELTKRVNLSIRVLASAMHWYERNLKDGCVRGNFGKQSLQLWDACAHLKAAEKQDRL